MSILKVLTCYPLALDSLDHQRPCGAKRDNSRNHRFNDRAYGLFDKKSLNVLDLGCAGGGFVKDCLDDGHLAVGLEGSDCGLVNQTGEWPNIPGHLFTCDITKDFRVVEHRKRGVYPLSFDLITCWEVMEHIPEDGLGQLFDNVRYHLAPGGLWVMSISPMGDPYHVCVHEKSWWADLFTNTGFLSRNDLVDGFGPDDWVRGPLRNAPGSFHFILESK